MTIFERSDFTLCDVPVPKGYPQSQTHVGVFPYEERLYLTSSPYPNIRRPQWLEYIRIIFRKISGGILCKDIRSEYYENPCLYSSNNGISFQLMQSRPLMEAPDPYYGFPAFNSDPDIFIEDGTIFVLNRTIFRTKLTPEKKRDEYQIRIYLIKGIIDKYKFKYISTQLFKETTELIVSPCMIHFRDRYIYMSLWTNCYNDGRNFEGLKFIASPSVEELSNADFWNTVKIDTSIWIPWHMSLFSYNDCLYSIVSCIKRGYPQRCYQMLGIFNDELTEMHIYKIPLTDYNSYRGAAFVDKSGDFFLYTTTVAERISGGKSCDGREVLMASLPFDVLLRKLKVD